MHLRQNIYLIALAAGLAFGGLVGSASAEGDPDVLYVPTPQYVVNEMLEIAATTKEDVVYDLGCGDGRYVITAAKKYSARGIGIDIDPQLVRLSQANARAAGVADRVRFIEADLFKTDISQATVVSLYLLPELNLQLRPKLFKELKPGARIVSHNYDMADWKPDISEELGSSSYFLWILPADVAGKWSVKLEVPGAQDYDTTVQLLQRFQEIEGQAISRGQEVDFTDEKLKGDRLSFFITRRIQGIKVDMHFKARVKGDSLSGEVQIEGGPLEGSQKFTAVRHK